MNRIVFKSRVGSNGILQLTLLVGPAEADRERVLETAGRWQGELERPEQGEYEHREPLS